MKTAAAANTEAQVSRKFHLPAWKPLSQDVYSYCCFSLLLFCFFNTKKIILLGQQASPDTDSAEGPVIYSGAAFIGTTLI